MALGGVVAAGGLFWLGGWGAVVAYRRGDRLGRLWTAQVLGGFAVWLAYLGLGAIHLSFHDRAAVKVANWHARVNIITLVIFIASFYLRTTSGAAWVSSMPMLPVILSVVGIVGLSIAGWLGGQLVFRHGVAVDIEEKSASRQPETQRHIRAA